MSSYLFKGKRVWIDPSITSAKATDVTSLLLKSGGLISAIKDASIILVDRGSQAAKTSSGYRGKSVLTPNWINACVSAKRVLEGAELEPYKIDLSEVDEEEDDEFELEEDDEEGGGETEEVVKSSKTQASSASTPPASSNSRASDDPVSRISQSSFSQPPDTPLSSSTTLYSHSPSLSFPSTPASGPPQYAQMQQFQMQPGNPTAYLPQYMTPPNMGYMNPGGNPMMCWNQQVPTPGYMQNLNSQNQMAFQPQMSYGPMQANMQPPQAGQWCFIPAGMVPPQIPPQPMQSQMHPQLMMPNAFQHPQPVPMPTTNTSPSPSSSKTLRTSQTSISSAPAASSTYTYSPLAPKTGSSSRLLFKKPAPVLKPTPKPMPLQVRRPAPPLTPVPAIVPTSRRFPNTGKTKEIAVGNAKASPEHKSGSGITSQDEEMDADEESPSRDSSPRPLFTFADGEPIQFFVQIGLRNRREVLERIRNNGGIVSAEKTDANFFLIHPTADGFETFLENAKAANIPPVLPVWLKDSIDQERLLDWHKFLVKGVPKSMLSSIEHEKSVAENLLKDSRGDFVVQAGVYHELNKMFPHLRPSYFERYPDVVAGKSVEASDNVTLPLTEKALGTEDLRSPTPPTGATQNIKGYYKYTDEEQEFANKYIEILLNRDPWTGAEALGKALNNKLVHHSTASWVWFLKRYVPGGLEDMRKRIFKEKGLDFAEIESVASWVGDDDNHPDVNDNEGDQDYEEGEEDDDVLVIQRDPKILEEIVVIPLEEIDATIKSTPHVLGNYGNIKRILYTDADNWAIAHGIATEGPKFEWKNFAKKYSHHGPGSWAGHYSRKRFIIDRRIWAINKAQDLKEVQAKVAAKRGLEQDDISESGLSAKRQKLTEDEVIVISDD